jgi:hypothetical protein
MQDVGGMENTSGKQRDPAHRWREKAVESLGHCQAVGNYTTFSHSPQAFFVAEKNILSTS